MKSKRRVGALVVGFRVLSGPRPIASFCDFATQIASASEAWPRLDPLLRPSGVSSPPYTGRAGSVLQQHTTAADYTGHCQDLPLVAGGQHPHDPIEDLQLQGSGVFSSRFAALLKQKEASR